MDTLPTYKVKWESDEDGIIYAISIVDTPANEMEFITLSKDKPLIQLSETNKEKQLLTGVVLIPDQLIYRNIDGKEFNLKFEKDTIEKLSFEYLNRGYQKNSTYNHDTPIKEGISVVESWITGKNDKAKDLGFDVPVGTWMVTMKLSDELWKDYVKTGKAKGFSIDSFLNTEKIDFKINNKKNNKNMKLKELLTKAINMVEENKEVKMASLEIDGVKYVSDSFAEGDLLYIEDAEGNREEAREVSITNEGMVHTTDAEGRIISVLPLEDDIDEVAEALKLLDENEELKMKIKEELMKEDKESYELKINTLEKEKEEVNMKLESKINDLEKEKEEINMKLQENEKKVLELKSELEKTPSETKLKANSKESVKTELSFYQRLNKINEKVNKNN